MHGTRTYAQLHGDTGRTFIAHSTASKRETGLESLMRARVHQCTVAAGGEGGAAGEVKGMKRDLVVQLWSMKGTGPLSKWESAADI
jgi:hypothetical protein